MPAMYLDFLFSGETLKANMEEAGNGMNKKEECMVTTETDDLLAAPSASEHVVTQKEFRG